MDTLKLWNNGRMFMCIRDFLINDISSSDTIENISKLLKDGADINAKDGNDNNNTILHITVSMFDKNKKRSTEDANVVNFLLNNGAQILPNKFNKTALDMALANDKKDIVNILKAWIVKHDKNSENSSIVTNTNLEQNQQCTKAPKRSLSCQSNDADINIPLYEKRPGTSGASGQFYESKLLSLILYRALHDQDIKDFILATNINGIGDFDDVCLRIDLFKNTVLCFLQAKHKEDPNKAKLGVNSLRSLTGPFSICKYYDSYIKIKQKVLPTCKDPMFQGEFHKLECNFILYTPLKECFTKKSQNKSICNKLHNFIYTGAMQDNINNIFQFEYEKDDIQFLTTYLQQENIKKLGKVFLDFILPGKNRSHQMMTSDLIRIYHPALAQKVINLEEVYEGRFRDDFINTDDENLIDLRTYIYEALVFGKSNKTRRSKSEVKKELKNILKKPNPTRISQLIEVLQFNKNTYKLKLNTEKVIITQFTQEEIDQIDTELQNMNVSLEIIKEAITIIGKKKLKSVTFQLPANFGNSDFTSFHLQREDILKLGTELLNIIQSNKINDEVLNYTLMRFYHPLLAQKVIDVYKFYKAYFREEFLDTDDEHLITLRESLINDIVFMSKNDLSIEEIKLKVDEIRKNPCSQTISKLIGNVLTIDKESCKLKTDTTKLSQKERYQIDNVLQKVHVSSTIIKNAVNKAGKSKLQSLVFKLPYTFGNQDFPTNKHKKEEIEERLRFFAKKLCNLIEKYTMHITNIPIATTSAGIENELTTNKNLIILEINSEVLQEKIFELSHINDIGGIGGAVGNLLSFDTITKMYMFNTKIETLKYNAKYMLEEIRQLSQLTHEDLSKFRININLPMCTFPRNNFDIVDNDTQLAREFLSKLWFYTDQANEEKVESILKTEIDQHYNLDKLQNQFLFRVYSDAIFLRFHDEVQKWWKSQAKAKYLTKSSNIFEEAKKSIVESPLLTVLNNMFIRNIKKYKIDFNTNSLNFLKLKLTFEADESTFCVINLITNAVILSAAKLIQCSNNEQLLEFKFINLDYVKVLPNCDYTTMIDEIKDLKTITLVICCETELDEYMIVRLTDMLRIFEGNVILITNMQKHIDPLVNLVNHKFLVVEDYDIGLQDLTSKSQNNLLENCQLIYQGETVSLNTIVNENTKEFICGKSLWSIINNIKIEIGRHLHTQKYDEIKDNYINRTLFHDDVEFEVHNLNDLDDNPVIISSEPCVGKSILVTHLSLETKKNYPQTWIVRINLVDYSKEFAEIKEKDIDILHVFIFLCKIALKNPAILENIEIFEQKNLIYIKDSKWSEINLLEIKLFINFFNDDKIVFIFDGFECVCPRSTHNAILFFQILSETNKRLWITSSCYYIKVLESKFNSSYHLPRLTLNQQESFIDRFFETNLKLETLNHEQYNNIALFLKFMFDLNEDKLKNRHLISFLSLPMQIIYLKAADYFKNEINNLTPAFLREMLKKKWRLNSYTAVDHFLGRSNEEQSLELAGTPLHMLLATGYFEMQIKEKFHLDLNTVEFMKKTRVYLNAFTSYERFLKNNLNNICNIKDQHHNFQAAQNAAREKFLEDHKNLALYALCKESDITKVLSEPKRKSVEKLIKKIELGVIKTPLIDCVVDGIPRFYHLIFAEYFLVEMATELLRCLVNKSANAFQLESLWDFLVNTILLFSPPGVRNAFEYKLKCDPELAELAADGRSSKIVFDMILKQNQENNGSGEEPETALNIAINKGCVNTTNFLLKAIKKHVNDDNIDGLMSIVKSSVFLAGAIKPDWKEASNDFTKLIKCLDGQQLIELLNSEQADQLPAMVDAVLTETDFGKRIKDRIKNVIREPVRETVEKVLRISSNNENLAILFDNLSQNLPEIVEDIGASISFLAKQFSKDDKD